MNANRIHWLLAVALLVSTSSPLFAAVGPTSTLYALNYGEFSGGTITGLDLMQGNTENSFPTLYSTDINIAVYGDVRTMGYSTGDKGSQFDLAGNPLGGGPYINSITGSQLHDGTSDGNYNYTVNYSTGDVLQYDRNWASPVVLFNATSNIVNAGYITMDASDGSFWLSQWGGPDKVVHFTHGGTVLGIFFSGINTSTGLALDPIDGTLWMADYGVSTLHQFSQLGVPLQTISYALTSQWFGMEFDTTPAVPEPATWTLMAIGGVALMWGARRRRRKLR